MVKLVVLYGHPEDPEAFEKYYFETHLVIASKIKNTEKVEITKFVGTPSGEKPLHYRMAELYFKDMEELETQLASPEGQAAVHDIPNFSTGGTDVLIAQV